MKIEVEVGARHTWLQTLLEQKAEEIARKRVPEHVTYRVWALKLEDVPTIHQGEFVFCVTNCDPYADIEHTYISVSLAEAVRAL